MSTGGVDNQHPLAKIFSPSFAAPFSYALYGFIFRSSDMINYQTSLLVYTLGKWEISAFTFARLGKVRNSSLAFRALNSMFKISYFHHKHQLSREQIGDFRFKENRLSAIGFFDVCKNISIFLFSISLIFLRK